MTGLQWAAERLVDMVDSSPEAAAFIADRYPGLDHAIDLVRRNLTQTDDGAAAPPATPTATPAATGGGLAAESATPTAAPSSQSLPTREALAQAVHHYYCHRREEETHPLDVHDYDKADEILEILGGAS